MTFQRPAFLLLLLLLPALWWFLRRGSARAPLVLKSAVFVLLALALADPWAYLQKRKLAITVLLDTSASMPRQALDRGKAVLAQLVRSDSGADLNLVTFADRARLHPVPGRADQVAIPRDDTLGAGTGTDIAAGLQLAMSAFPQQGTRRVLLISDGNENRGQALTQALRARQSGVEIFSVPAGGAAQLPVEVESIALPQHVLAGERFTLSLRLNSGKALDARVSILAQGREIGSAPVRLRDGSNSVDVDTRMTGEGVTLLEVRIAGDGAERTLLSHAVAVRRPRVLYIAGGDDRSEPLLDTLRRAQVNVETASALPAKLATESWDALLFDNFPDHPLSPAENAALESYVSRGGGLITIAGDKNARFPETPQTAFERLLPVRGDPDTAPEETTAVVLVLDRSASMNGLKIAMAREAGSASIVLLRPTDKIGVVAFDSRFDWVVPITPAADVPRIRRAIRSITADGGTDMYPAMLAAFEALRRERSAHKHIIVLTDGLSQPGEFTELAMTAGAEHVTISTIGIGDDVNRKLLEDLARYAQGKPYFVDDPEKIPQIMSDEVRSAAASPIQERSVSAVAVRPMEFTDGVNFKSAPPLLGYVKARAKEGAETTVRVSTGSPLVVRWQFGLGRVTTFLSDARGRWSAPWLNSPVFTTLWPQMVRDVCQPDRSVRAGVRRGSRDGEAVVYYDLLGSLGGSHAAAPRVIVSAPGEPARTVTLDQTAQGHFEVRIPVARQGVYRVGPAGAGTPLPEVGYFRDSDELRQREINLPLLTELARVTNGRVAPTLGQVLDDRGAYARQRRPLWPYLLSLALILNFVELALRKGLFSRARDLAIPSPRWAAAKPS